MAADMVEMVMLDEVIDTSIDEQLLLDYDNDGEIHLFAAIGAFMRRDLNRIVGFYAGNTRRNVSGQTSTFSKPSIHNFTYYE